MAMLTPSRPSREGQLMSINQIATVEATKTTHPSRSQPRVQTTTPIFQVQCRISKTRVRPEMDPKEERKTTNFKRRTQT